MDKAGNFKTVADLIDYLGRFDMDTQVIVDNDGSTYPLNCSEIYLWDENDPSSPLAFDAAGISEWK